MIYSHRRRSVGESVESYVASNYLGPSSNPALFGCPRFLGLPKLTARKSHSPNISVKAGTGEDLNKSVFVRCRYPYLCPLVELIFPSQTHWGFQCIAEPSSAKWNLKVMTVFFARSLLRLSFRGKKQP